MKPWMFVIKLLVTILAWALVVSDVSAMYIAAHSNLKLDTAFFVELNLLAIVAGYWILIADKRKE